MADFEPAWKRHYCFCPTYHCIVCRRLSFDVLMNTKTYRMFLIRRKNSEQDAKLLRRKFKVGTYGYGIPLGPTSRGKTP